MYLLLGVNATKSAKAHDGFRYHSNGRAGQLISLMSELTISNRTKANLLNPMSPLDIPLKSCSRFPLARLKAPISSKCVCVIAGKGLFEGPFSKWNFLIVSLVSHTYRLDVKNAPGVLLRSSALLTQHVGRLHCADAKKMGKDQQNAYAYNSRKDFRDDVYIQWRPWHIHVESLQILHLRQGGKMS